MKKLSALFLSLAFLFIGVPHSAGDVTVTKLTSKPHQLFDGTFRNDDLTNDLVRSRFAQPDVARGFLLDGYPRTRDQVLELDNILADRDQRLDAVILITADLEELVRRLSRRAQEQGRSDDTEQVIHHRQDVYREQTQPLIEIYSERGMVVEIDGLGQVDEVTHRILNALTERGLSPVN